MKSHLSRSIPLFFLLFSLPALAADKKAPPAKPANQYAAFDAHPQEHLTIAADPCDDPKDCNFFRLPYLRHGFIAVRVVFTNDGDAPINLDEARIQFLSANNDVIPAATDDDLQRRLFTPQSAIGRKIPMPLPLPPITVHGKSIDKNIPKDDNDFGFKTTTVDPHSTLAGYLFYDVSRLDEPVLKDASLYVKQVYTTAKDGGKKQLFSFTIPFNKWLSAHPDTESTTR